MLALLLVITSCCRFLPALASLSCVWQPRGQRRRLANLREGALRKRFKKETMSQSAALESCFANGLDLSEFSNARTTGTDDAQRPPSHAAQLMKETQKKAEDRRRNYHQEHVLGRAVQERLVAHHQTPQRPEALHHAALIQMHSADQKEPRQRLMKGPKTMSKKKTAGKKQSSTKGRGQKKSGRARGKF